MIRLKKGGSDTNSRLNIMFFACDLAKPLLETHTLI